MEFYKNNAYPEIFLHDCECKINYDNEKQILQFVFDVGFCLKDDGKGNIERKPGIIQFSNLPLDEIEIKIDNLTNKEFQINEDLNITLSIDANKIPASEVDGVVSTVMNVQEVYLAAGTYGVMLPVTKGVVTEQNFDEFNNLYKKKEKTIKNL